MWKFFEMKIFQGENFQIYSKKLIGIIYFNVGYYSKINVNLGGAIEQGH